MIKDICAQVFDGRLAGLNRDVASLRHDVAGTKRDVTQQLEEFEHRVIEHVDERLDELREDARQHTGAMIDEEFYGIKVELQDYIDKDLEQGEEKFVERVNSARLSLELGL